MSFPRVSRLGDRPRKAGIQPEVDGERIPAHAAAVDWEGEPVALLQLCAVAVKPSQRSVKALCYLRRRQKLTLRGAKGLPARVNVIVVVHCRAVGLLP